MYLIYIYIIMAAIAIPLLALGGMYVVSKNNKNNEPKSYEPNNNAYAAGQVQEGYENMNKTRNVLPGINPPLADKNYPTPMSVSSTNVNLYRNPNQYSDKYFDPKMYKEVEINNAKDYGVGGSVQSSYSLTGKPIDKDNFKHGNMVPFFGGKIRGATAEHNITESVLDNMQGSGSQYFNKKEQAPLFKPQDSYQYANGVPNQSDFLQSRVNPSMRMANVKPWEEQRVAPGLNQGFTSTGGTSGFNSGMEARELWLDKTVDQLRVSTNPKTTFELAGHEGPGTHYIKNAPTAQTQGKVEKHLPDKYYVSGPDRWLTTTGLEKAQTARGVEILHDVNRTNTSAEYYGSRANLNEGTYVPREYQKTRRPVLPVADSTSISAKGQGGATTGDYGIKSYSNLANNRATTRHELNVGPVNGFMKAIVSPLMDFLRPSRKEDVVYNMRSSGNASAPVERGHVYNSADRTKTTIREMTEAELDCNHLNVEHQSANAYLVSAHQPVHVQRDTTNMSHTGTAGPNGFSSAKSYEAEYKQRNNINKTYENRPNQGGTQIFNQQENIDIHRRDADRDNNRWWVPSSGGTAGITAPALPENYSRVKVTQGYDPTFNNSRIEPDILSAFKSNPYTQSLTSWA